MMRFVTRCLLLIFSLGLTFGTRNKRIVLEGEQNLQEVVAMLQSEVTDLKSKVASIESKSGSVYIRWGRTSCPVNGTVMMYNGRMAGSKWNEYGGGSNSLCLPNDPTWGKYVDGVDSSGTIYGTEIEVSGNVAHALFGKDVYNEDIPCAVCRTVRHTNVMVPGRASCYPGWTKEYQGYVISSSGSWHNDVDYVCLDENMEFANHGAANDEEHVVKVVEVRCGTAGGSLSCPPYVNGRELACVVCSM